MTDRIVASLWWLLVTGFIVGSAASCVLSCYQGLLNAIANRWAATATSTGCALAAGILCLIACRHRNDLLI